MKTLVYGASALATVSPVFAHGAGAHMHPHGFETAIIAVMVALGVAVFLMRAK